MFYNLKAEIARRGWKDRDLAKAAGMSVSALSQKINGKSDFKRSEMIALRKALGCEEIILDKLFEEADTEA